MTELLICDWQECLRLLNNNHAMAVKLLKRLVQQLPDDLHLMQQYLMTADYTALLALIHKLHGALCYVSLPRLKSVVAPTESLLRVADGVVNHDAVVGLISLISAEIATIIATDFTKILDSLNH